MPLLLFFVGLILTVAGAVRVSPFWAVAGTVPPVGAYAVLLLGLIAMTMVVPWLLIRLVTGLQTALTDDLPSSGKR
jgi:hypothetical protein